MEPSFALFLLCHLQTVVEIVLVTVQKAFFLDEVDKHQPVEHDRHIPFAYVHVRNALNKFLKGVTLFFLEVIEAPCGLFYVEGCANSAGDVYQGEAFFLLESEGNAL